MTNKLIPLGMAVIVLTVFLSLQPIQSHPGTEEFLEQESSIYTSKYYLGDNEYKIITSSDVINYYDDQGNLKPIDLTITQSQDLNYDYEATKSVYRVYFKSTPNTADTVKILSKGHELYIQTSSLNYRDNQGQSDQASTPSNINAIINENKITYPSIFGSGIDLKYEFLNSRLKQTLIIENNESLEEPAEYIIPGACFPFCFDHNVTLDLDFIFRFDNNLEIEVNEEVWNQESAIETSNEIIFKDKTTGETIFIFEKPITLGSYDTSIGKYTLKKQGNKLYIIHKTDWNFIRIPEMYPIEIDPTTDLNYSKKLFYGYGGTCTAEGDCCTGGGGPGTCVDSAACDQSDTAVGLTKLVDTGCDSCAYPSLSCCKTKSSNVVENKEYYQFNLSDGINSSFMDINVTSASVNLDVSFPAFGKHINVSHVDDNSTACDATHTVDNHTQPGAQPASTSMNFTFTNHVQEMINTGQEIVWFIADSYDNTNRNYNKVGSSTLEIIYTATVWNETRARQAIEEGIVNSEASGADIFTGQQIYTVNETGNQSTGSFDKVAIEGNQTWAFNYLTGSESFTFVDRIMAGNTVNVWENESLIYEEIVEQVSSKINETRS